MLAHRAQHFRSRRVIKRIDNEIPAHVIRRKSANQPQVIRRRGIPFVAECVRRRASRSVVNALAPGERALHLEAVEYPLIQLQLEAVIRRSALPKNTAADLDERIVERSLLL